MFNILDRRLFFAASLTSPLLPRAIPSLSPKHQPFSILWKKAVQTDFHACGNRGIKAGSSFYYHSIIK
jgi:hypothetical protein